MVRYIKRQVIYTVATLNRMGMNTHALRLAAGFALIDETKPVYDANVEYLVENGVVNGVMTYTVTPLSVAEITANIKKAAVEAIGELQVRTELLVNSSYISNALGTDHEYASKTLEDKVNTLGAKMLGASFNFTCTEVATGIKTRRLHTAAQMTKVYKAGIAHIDGYQALIWAAIGAISASTSVAQIEGIRDAYLLANPLPAV